MYDDLRVPYELFTCDLWLSHHLQAVKDVAHLGELLLSRFRLPSVAYLIEYLASYANEERNINTNSRFAVAIHVLTMLAYKVGELITSEFIAKSVTTNPVVIRRVLGDLRKAGLVESHSGNRGGWKLSKEAEKITIKDAYLAVREGSLFGLPPQNPNPNCLIGARIGAVVNKLFGESEASLLDYFQTATIASLFRDIEIKDDTIERENCPKRRKI